MIRVEYSRMDQMAILVVALAISSFSMTIVADVTVGCQGPDSEPKDGLGSHINNTILADPKFNPFSLLHLSDEDYETMGNLAGASIFTVLAGAPIVDHYDPSKPSTSSSSVATGAAGQALMFLKLYENNYRFSVRRAKQSIIHAHSYIDTAVGLVPQNLSNIGFIEGSSGVYAIASVVYQIVGDHSNSDNMIVKLKHVIKDAIDYPDKSKIPMNLENGMAGLAYSARFVNTFYQFQVIAPGMYYSIIDVLIQFGYDHLIKQANDIWSWPSSGKSSDTGLLKGDSGPLYTILQAIRFDEENRYKSNHTLLETATATVDAILVNNDYLEQADFPTDQTHPTNLYEGAASYIPVFWTAYRVLNDTKYYNVSMNAAKYTAKFGILNTGMQMGVGTAGNAYMILWLAAQIEEAQSFDYQRADKPQYDSDIAKLIAYANSMHKIALQTPTLTDPTMMVSYHCAPFSFWFDSPAAMAVAYSDLLSHHYSTEDIHMPGFSEIL